MRYKVLWVLGWVCAVGTISYAFGIMVSTVEQFKFFPMLIVPTITSFIGLVFLCYLAFERIYQKE